MFIYKFSRLGFKSSSVGDILEVFRDRKKNLGIMYWTIDEINSQAGDITLETTQYLFRVKSLKEKEDFIPSY